MKKKILAIFAAISVTACSVNVSETQDASGNGMLSAKAQTPGICSYSERGNGEALFSVRLPSGQAYVEIFIRQNGQQNVAQPIMASEMRIGDGTSFYTFNRNGYIAGDRIEYRFYSYLPANPGLFTPGPTEGVWNTVIYGSNPNTFTVVSNYETNTNVYQLGEQTENGETISYEVVTSTANSTAQGMFTGWGLYRAKPSSSNTALVYNRASLTGVYIKKAGQNIYVPVSETAYNYSYLSTGIDGGSFYWNIANSGSVEPAGYISTTYEENIVYGTVNTYIGRQTIPVSGKATFAYLVKHYNYQIIE